MSHQRKVMVVYGRDTRVKDALFAWLRTIDLRPQEWEELVHATGSPSPYTGDVLDKAMAIVQAVVVLFTPDDLAQLRTDLLDASDGSHEHKLSGQPRANVLFEAGLAFGRHPTRTVLVEHGKLRGLSDLAGLNAVRLERGGRALVDLAHRLSNVGCAVNLTGADFLDESLFSALFPARPDTSEAIAKCSPVTSDPAGTPAGRSGADPLERLVTEILAAQLPAEPAENIVTEIARRLRKLQRPIRRGELFEDLPGRRIPEEAIRQTFFELEQHGILKRNPDERVRGYVLGELP
jgi:Predicted nucleotide-binding protein containing TIR-like domain